MLVFVAAATGLRVYLTVLTATGYTYGALATPIAFLLFAFLLGLSIVLGRTAEQRRPGGLAGATGALAAAGRAPHTGLPHPAAVQLRRAVGATGGRVLARVRTRLPVPARGPRRL